jgi:hypothetical protein
MHDERAARQGRALTNAAGSDNAARSVGVDRPGDATCFNNAARVVDAARVGDTFRVCDFVCSCLGRVYWLARAGGIVEAAIVICVSGQ